MVAVSGGLEIENDASKVAESENEGVERKKSKIQSQELEILPGMSQTRVLTGQHCDLPLVEKMFSFCRENA